MLEIIPVRPAGSCSGWVVIELQGELDFDSDKKALVRHIGTMVQAHHGSDTLQLNIGHHQLTGRLVDLKKPLLVLEKSSEPQTSYQVIAIHELAICMMKDWVTCLCNSLLKLSIYHC